MSNALNALLGAKPVSEITEKVTIKRLGTEFVIKALTGDDIDGIRTQATRAVKNGKKIEQVVNESEVSRLLVAKGVVEPNFADKSVLDHFGATDAGEAVQKALLAGEITTLQEAIFGLSGFGEMDEEIEEVKN